MASVEHKSTFCRICEPLCGMVATVEDGRLTALRPDKDHPLSAGFACQKGIAFTEVVNDPDRVTTPLRRTADGFEPVSWDEAMADIAERLADIHRRHGSGAIGWYYGNPGAFSYSHILSLAMFMAGFGPRLHVFTAGSQDVNNRFVASQLLYGSPLALPIPDVLRTDLLVVIGANPIVSHGSVLTVPRIKDRMHDIVKRGGRVLVIDPRKTETAAQFEWLGIVPDGDAYLLLSLLHVLFGEHLVDLARLARQADGADWLERLARPFSPEATAPHTGIDPDTVRTLARDLARTPRAAVYGRVGTSTGENGTLTTYLLDAVNLVAGNLDVPGGSMFGRYGLPGERWLNKAGGALLRTVYARRRSRVGGFPSVLMSEPAGVMAKEITTPGAGQVRALVVSAGNPVLSVPNGDELEKALDKLELTVGIDLYVNETLAHCDYVLPATTMYERDDFPLPFQTLLGHPVPPGHRGRHRTGGAGPRRVAGHRRHHPPVVAPHAGVDGHRLGAKGIDAVRCSAQPAAACRRHHPTRRRRRQVRAAARRADILPAGRRSSTRHGAGREPARRCPSRHRRLPRAPGAVAAQRDRRGSRGAVATPCARRLSDEADRHA